MKLLFPLLSFLPSSLSSLLSSLLCSLLYSLSLIAFIHLLYLRLNVSVDVRVPEQSLVSVTPEKLLLSKVLVLILSGPFFIWKLSQVLSVLGMMHFNVHNWNGGQCNGRECNQVSQSLPGVGNSFGMLSFFRLFFDEFFTSFFVHMWESGLGNVLGHMTVARGVEAGKGALAGSSKHRDGLSTRMKFMA